MSPNRCLQGGGAVRRSTARFFGEVPVPDWPYRGKDWDMPSLLPPTQSQLRDWLGLLRLPSGRVGEG